MLENFLKRTTLDVPGDLEKDQLSKLISDAMGHTIKLTDEEYLAYKKGNEHKIKIKELIEPFYSDLKILNTKNSEEKADELIDVGRFIYTFNQEMDESIKILECPEKDGPDFIIQYKNFKVGLEHTRLIDDEVVQEISETKKTIERVKQLVLKKAPPIKGVFNLYINQDKNILYNKNYGNYTEAQKKVFNVRKSEIPKEIAAYIIALINKENITKPATIDKVVVANAEDFEIRLSESYIAKQLTFDKISSRIKAKEEKLETYLNEKDLEYCWLVMVVEGISSKSSYEIIQENLPKEKSTFDQVFIFDKFSSKIYYSLMQ